MPIRGACHCGNIAFALTWQPAPAEIPVRACRCTFCTRHGGRWTSCPGGTLEVTVDNPAFMSNYAFGTRTAEFHVCARCGAVPVVTSRIDGVLYAVVNVNCCVDLDPALLRTARVSFDAEDPTARLARRRRSWIGTVRFLRGR